MTPTPKQKQDFVERGFSRRNFGRLATMLAASSTLPFYNEFSLAQEVDSRVVPAGVDPATSFSGRPLASAPRRFLIFASGSKVMLRIRVWP